MRSPNENVEFISEPHIKHEPPESFDGHSIESGKVFSFFSCSQRALQWFQLTFFCENLAFAA